MNQNEVYQSIVQRLQKTRSRETMTQVVVGLLQTVCVSSLIFFVLSLLESVAHTNIATRTVLFYSWLITTIATGVSTVGRTVWKRVLSHTRPSVDEIARRVGASFVDIQDMLLNAMQLVPLIEANGPQSAALAQAAFFQVHDSTKERDFDVIINREPLRRFIILCASIATVLILIGSFTGVGAAAIRLLNFRQSFVPPPPFELNLEPMQARVLHGEKVRITIRVKGVGPQQLTLQLKEEQQQNYDAYTLREDSTGLFHFDIPSLKQSIEFYAEVPWFAEFIRTEHGHVWVSDRPIIRAIDGRLSQPSYTGLASTTFTEQNADIVCLRGSRVELNISANKALSRARVILEKSKEPNTDSSVTASNADTVGIEFSVNDRTARAEFPVHVSGFYWIELQDKEGRFNADPIRYSIQAQTDGYPSITLMEPQIDVQLGTDALMNVKVAVNDDYGFSLLHLKYRLAESRYASAEKDFKSISIAIPPGVVSAEIPYVWDMNKVGISPDDRYEFYVEVFDNDRVSGPKSAKTSILSVRLPSLDEVFKQAKKTQTDAVKELEKVMKKAEDVARDMDQLQRELMKQKQMQADWKDKKKMDELLKQQDQIQEKVKEVQDKLEEMTQMLQDNKAISPETMQKYMELQKLMQKIDSKELRDAMEQMQKAMQQMSPEQMQEAMKNFKFNEEDFKKQIERTMQLLKRIQTEQKVDELAKRAEELQHQQEQLQKQSENSNPSDKNAREEMAKKQQALEDDMKKLAQELKELEKLSKEAGLDKQQNVADEMNKAMDQLNADMTQKQMSQSEKNLEEGELSKAQQNMKNAAQNLKNFSQGMKKMKQEMKKNLQRETARQMQASMNDMMSLSKAEEQLMKDAQQMDQSSSRMSQNARQQQKLREQMMNLANKMNQLGQKSTAVTPEMGKEMGDAMRQMQSAQENMENRNSAAAAQQQQGAMASMNKAMQQMAGALQKMNGGNPGEGDGEGEGDPNNPNGSKPGGKMGFMQRLQQAANMQQGINQGMQQMGQGLGQQQQAELGRLAAQQGKVQKSLQELAQEQKESSGSKKTLGNLERLADEMKEVLSDMQSGHITDETRRRQDRILSRLLDASRSMNERDYEKTRESRAGEDLMRKSPAELSLDELRQKQSMQDFLKSMQQGYTKDYEQLIRQYFEQLQKVPKAQSMQR